MAGGPKSDNFFLFIFMPFSMPEFAGFKSIYTSLYIKKNEIDKVPLQLGEGVLSVFLFMYSLVFIQLILLFHICISEKIEQRMCMCIRVRHYFFFENSDSEGTL